MKSVLLILILGWVSLAHSEEVSRGSRFTIDETGVNVSSPSGPAFQGQITDQGAEVNFSLFGSQRPSNAPVTGQENITPPTVIRIPTGPSSLTPSEDFFKNIGK